MKVPGFRLLLLYLPSTISPLTAKSIIRRPDGFVSRIELCVTANIDRAPWGSCADIGSKPWLVSQALSGDSDSSIDGIYGEQTVKTSASSLHENDLSDTPVGDDETLPEDKFHIKLPFNVDQYTGVMREEEEEELPEDRFHKKDAASSYLISQREQAVTDKWAKHAKEKEDRENNPDSNIEYVDVDDYKPGGKYGPVVEELTDEVLEQQVVRDELQRAAKVVASSLEHSEIGSLLSSHLCYELLD
jgi:hypothetical protein